MSRKAGLVFYAACIAIGIAVSVGHMYYQAACSETSRILRSCGVDPWTGGSLDSGANLTGGTLAREAAR